AGVLATEAFDLAGDPSVFSEQISPASYSERDLDRTEGLQPWQPEKIYYFNTPTHDDIFAGRGPQYPAKGTSPSRHVTYGMLAAEALAHHRTQGGDHVTRAIENHTLDNSQDSYVQLATMPVQLFFGRSLVPSGVTDDVFAGVVPGGIPFQQPARSPALQDSNPAIKIGDPWNFYQVFLKAHGIGHLANVVTPEITVKVGRVLSIPLIIDNPFDTTIKVDLSVQAPSGWKVTPTLRSPSIRTPGISFGFKPQLRKLYCLAGRTSTSPLSQVIKPLVLYRFALNSPPAGSHPNRIARSR